MAITDTLEASADAHTKSADPNKNYGAADSLTVRSFSANPTNRFETYVKFDLVAIEAQIGTGQLDSVKLELYPKFGFGWPTGGDYINAYRIPNAWAPNGWTETGITKNCPNDTNTSNAQLNCPGGVWDTTGFGLLSPTDQVLLTNNTQNWISFDVTADVNAWLTGTANHGWHLAKQNNNNNQRIVFWSRESTRPPRLILWITHDSSFTLSAVVERGVTGSPAMGHHRLSSGAQVEYSYVPALGFQNVGVMIDGVPAPAAGTINMDAAHVLLVSADQVVQVSAGDQGLLQAARAVFTNSDPAAAYQAYLEQVSSMSEGTSVEDAEARLAAVEFLAFDPVTDSAALRRVDRALAHRIFRIGPPQGGVDSAAERTSFVFVNGINTTPDEAVFAQTQLRRLLRQDSIFTHPAFEVIRYYNPTWRQEGTESFQERAAACIAMVERRSRFLGSVSRQLLFARCLYQRAFNPVTDVDLLEAVLQFRDVALGIGLDIDAMVLADTLQSLRNAGRHAIVMPHSQGNLLIQEALHDFRANYGYAEDRDSTCVGVISLAAPTHLNWSLPAARLKGIVLRGDLVPDAGLNAWPRIDNSVTRAALDTIAMLEAQLADMEEEGANAFQVEVLRRKFLIGKRIHEVVGSYLVPTESRDSIRAAARFIYEDCAADSIEVTLTTISMIPASLTKVDAVVRNAHDQPLQGRRIAWTTSNSAVASVDSAGWVLGLSPGTATITARVGANTATVNVTISPPPTTVYGRWGGVSLPNSLRLGPAAPSGQVAVELFILGGGVFHESLTIESGTLPLNTGSAVLDASDPEGFEQSGAFTVSGNGGVYTLQVSGGRLVGTYTGPSPGGGTVPVSFEYRGPISTGSLQAF